MSDGSAARYADRSLPLAALTEARIRARSVSDGSAARYADRSLPLAALTEARIRARSVSDGSAAHYAARSLTLAALTEARIRARSVSDGSAAHHADRSLTLPALTDTMQTNAPHSDFHTHDRFMRLYSQHYLRLHAYIGTFLYRGADIDDTLQETSVVLWEKFVEFRPTSDQAAAGEFAAWACTIARYKVLQHMRAHGRGTIPLDEKLIDLISDKQAAMTEQLAERREALTGCLKKLPPVDRSLIDACYHGDRAFKDIAEELGRPVNSVYKSLGRIRGVLMACIDRALHGEARS